MKQDLQELEKLFKEIVAVNGKASNEHFMDKWTELCLKHDLQTVVKAWGDISENCSRWDYYELRIWKQKLEYYEPRKEDDNNRAEYIKNARKTKQWSNKDKDNWNENNRMWEQKEQTFREYLENGLKIGQMNESFVASEMVRWGRIGKNLDDYFKGIGGW